MRGHQLTDWGFYMTDKAFEQFVRELIVFGCNQIEFAHIMFSQTGRHDGAALVRLSQIVDKYGLAVSLYNIPWPSKATETAFRLMPRIDSIFSEDNEEFGGRSNLEAAARVLRQYHPHAKAWHDPGGLNRTQMDDWFTFLAAPNTAEWLDGGS